MTELNRTVRLSFFTVSIALVAPVATCAKNTATRSADSPPTRAQVSADTIFVGGDVWTLDSALPRASAVAVADGRILVVGTDAEVRETAASSTVVVELDGRTVIPGLIDSHAHLYGLGSSLEAIRLRGESSAEAVAQKVADAASKVDVDDWITGRGWDQNLWKRAEFPTREVLDKVVGNRPVALRRVDGHALWASSAALAKAGVDKNTKSPSGGTIVRDARGEPTGIFIDNAMSLIESKIPRPSTEAIRRRIQRAAAVAVAAGLTGVHEMGVGPEVVEVYRELAETGELPLRVYAFLSGSASAFATQPDTTTGAARFTVRAFKLFADGALGSRGARMAEPYSDQVDSHGLWVTLPEQLRAEILEGTRRGWQIGVHAIGDDANHETLNAFAAALAETPARKPRHRVEHAQIVSAEDISRFGKLGVIASMQPTHATSDMPWAEARVGPKRMAGAYAWRTLSSANARIVFGSDFPVERVSPLLGIWAATTRTDDFGNPVGGWRPSEVLTIEEAVAAFSREGAHASFSENERGQLKVGYLADITIFDAPLTQQSLKEIRVQATIVGGKTVFRKP